MQFNNCQIGTLQEINGNATVNITSGDMIINNGRYQSLPVNRHNSPSRNQIQEVYSSQHHNSGMRPTGDHIQPPMTQSSISSSVPSSVNSSVPSHQSMSSFNPSYCARQQTSSRSYNDDPRYYGQEHAPQHNLRYDDVNEQFPIRPQPQSSIRWQSNHHHDVLSDIPFDDVGEPSDVSCIQEVSLDVRQPINHTLQPRYSKQPSETVCDDFSVLNTSDSQRRTEPSNARIPREIDETDQLYPINY